jgi:uncharacterized OB-fold protein
MAKKKVQPMVRLKKGDQAEIIAQINGHDFKVGRKVKVEVVRDVDYLVTDGKESWYVTDAEIKAIK